MSRTNARQLWNVDDAYSSGATIMLETCRDLGEQALRGKSDVVRKQLFLRSQSIVPELSNKLETSKQYELVVNLRPSHGQIELKPGHQLDPDRRDRFFGFELMGKAGRKIYFTTNRVDYHIYTLSDAVDYLDDKFPSGLDSLKRHLEQLRDRFCINLEDGSCYLDLTLLPSKWRERQTVTSFEEKHELSLSDRGALKEKLAEKSFVRKYRSFLTELMSKEVLEGTRKNDARNVNICSLKIDDEYIHESDFGEDYVKMVYFERQQRFFDSGEPMAKQDKVCSLCQTRQNITGKIDIPTKFYITDKPYFFENGKDKNAYRSFALCEPCYQAVQVGIDHIHREFEDWFLGCRYFLLPKRARTIEDLDRKTAFVRDKILSQSPSSIQDELKKQRDLVKEMMDDHLRFDFLFFFRDQASFNVVETIPDVRIADVLELADAILDLNSTELYAGLKPSFSLNSLRYLLFPNKQSHSNPDPQIYRKDLVGLFKVLVKGQSVSMRSLISRYREIFARTYHRQERSVSTVTSSLNMNRLLELFARIANLRGVNTMAEHSSVTEVPDEPLEAFFETHERIYASNPTRQGLVMLGWIINSIWYEQSKQNKSATVLDKLNFDGMAIRRLKRFINEITKYLKIYGQWNRYNAGLHAAMMDRLQEVEHSGESKDEVLFYILTGFALARHSGFRRGTTESNGKGNQDE